MLRRTLLILSVSVLGLFSAPASAQQPPAGGSPAGGAPPGPPPPPPDGLSVMLNSQGTFALTDMTNVVGQQPGTTINFGVKFNSRIEYRKGKHEFGVIAGLQTALTQTPLFDDFIKTADTLRVAARYNFHLRKWVRPFAVATMMGPILRGFDVRPVETPYRLQLVDGTFDSVTRRTFTLTEPLRPLAFEQSAGAMFYPVTNEKFTLSLAATVGGREVIADGQFVLVDNPATPEVELRETRSYQLFGTGFGIELGGKLIEQTLSYSASFSALIPLVLSEGAKEATPGSTTLERSTVQGDASVSLKLNEYASLDYQFTLIREPQLTDQWQRRHGLMLSLGASYKKAPRPKEEPKKEEPKKETAPKAEAKPDSSMPNASAPAQ